LPCERASSGLLGTCVPDVGFAAFAQYIEQHQVPRTRRTGVMMPKRNLTPEGEVIAAYGAAMVAAFQVLINRMPGTTGVGANGQGIAGIAQPQAAPVANSTAGASAGYSCNPDWGVAQVGGRVAWTPVKNLTFSTEVMYTNLMQNMVGQAYQNVSNSSGRNSGIYDFANQGTVGGYFRVERQF
jgi:hypothetical protein